LARGLIMLGRKESIQGSIPEIEKQHITALIAQKPVIR
jgi:hypothetical protein